MRTIRFVILIYFLLIWSINSFSNTFNSYTEHKKIKFQLQKGNYIQAQNLCQIELNKRRLNDNQRYELLTIKSKIYYFEDRLSEFNQSTVEAYRLKKYSSPIYKAYYFAQKAHYFHYHMIGDSATFYADQAMKTLHKNWKDRTKVPFYFIYQMYGTTYLYRTLKSKPSWDWKQHKTNRLRHILTYYDSALLYLKTVRHFPQEKAILYRSIGNRIMDVVGYKIRKHITDFEDRDFQVSYAQKAIKTYIKSLNALDSNERIVRYSIKSLLALAYYCINKTNLGDKELWPMISSFQRAGKNMSLDERIAFLHVLQYFTQNILERKIYDSRIEKVINIYLDIHSDWYGYLLYKNKNFKDTYGFSPSTMLILINTWLNSNGKCNDKLSNAMPNLILGNYLFYSELANNSHSIRSGSIKGTQVNEFVNVRHIQDQLKPTEALLVKAQSSMFKINYLLITRSSLHIDTMKRFTIREENEFSTSNAVIFKKGAFQHFLGTPFSKIFKTGTIKKLFVAIDIDENYDYMVLDSLGSTFETLNYLKRKINVVKVYNPIDFFNQSDQVRRIDNKIHPILLNRNTKIKLPFSVELFKRKKNIKVLNSTRNMEDGITHIIGHGNLHFNFRSGEFSNTIQKKQDQHWTSQTEKIKSDLIVLNLCYGGYKRTTFLPDRDLHHHLISKGAKAVIASPYETVDQSSAYIFEKFYAYLDKGETAENALQYAKLDYLRTHSGSLAHPMYWSTYELTSNVKDLRLAPLTRRIFWEWIPVLIFLIGVSGSLVWIVVKKR